ncbi:unnamed protein product [Peronospora belbahrii]|uniref:Uncharacterized protein n=1 Tax=Peronospora belbahrii TaxID=622444 RepID=A0ABN8CNJ7_9STRA|nr:unnamed protein product [Peronospora belbahrii]
MKRLSNARSMLWNVAADADRRQELCTLESNGGACLQLTLDHSIFLEHFLLSSAGYCNVCTVLESMCCSQRYCHE